MHEIGESPLGVRRAIAEKDQVRTAQQRDRRVVRRHVDEQPVVPRRRAAARQDRVDDVEGRQVHEAGVGAGFAAQLLVLVHDLAPRERHDEFLPVARTHAGHVRHLRFLDRERRGLAHLPAHELIEIRRARRHLLEADQRHFGNHVGHRERYAPRPAHLVEDAIERRHHGGAIDRVLCRQRRHERVFGDRFDRMRGDHRLAAAPLEARSRHASSGDVHGHWRRRTLAERRERAHSTNVTLLISRSVVTPAMTCSTADSRRNRMPSSRAAFLISDVGRFSRIISRM